MADNFFKIRNGVNIGSSATAPANPQQGDVYYNTTDKRFYFYQDGKWVHLGEGGSGEGRINYITNANALDNTDGWVSAGLAALERSTDLDKLPRAFTTPTGLYLEGSGDSNDYASYNFTLDPTDLNKKLGIELAFNTEENLLAGEWLFQVWQNTQSDYSGSWTKLYETTTWVAGISELSDSFDSTNVPYLQLRIKAVNSAASIYVSNVYVGPGSIVTGAAISEWQPYTPSFTGFTVSSSAFTWRRVGESIEVNGVLQLSSSVSSVMAISLPDGLGFPSSLAVGALVGNALSADAGVGYYTGTVVPNTDMKGVRFRAGGGSPNNWDTSTPFTWASGDELFVSFSGPIEEWSGEGVLNLGGNEVEYAYNTGGTTAAGGQDVTNFAYGPAGAPIGAINSTTVASWTSFRVRFKNKIKATDIITLEFNNGMTSTWYDAATYAPFSRQYDAVYGVFIQPYDDDTVTVFFGNCGINASGSTYGTPGSSWNNIAAYRWRVKRSTGGQAVGFGRAVIGTSGLISQETSGTFTAALSGSAASGSATLKYSVSGNNVIITVPDISWTSSDGTYLQLSFANLPMTLRPPAGTIINHVMRVSYNPGAVTTKAGLAIIRPDYIQVYSDVSGAAWPFTDTQNIWSFSFTYSL